MQCLQCTVLTHKSLLINCKLHYNKILSDFEKGKKCTVRYLPFFSLLILFLFMTFCGGNNTIKILKWISPACLPLLGTLSMLY